MKGVILAGGKGTRLGRLTKVTNKHLVAVGNQPMIEYPLSTFEKMDLDDLFVVTGTEHVGTIATYLTGVHPELDITYKVQKEAGGIAQALGLMENIIKDDNLVVILGDNYFEGDFSSAKEEFEKSNFGAMLFLKYVEIKDLFYVDDKDKRRAKYGIAEVKGDKIISTEEKPEIPKSNLAVTGLYLFDATVFEKIKRLKPSWRGEFEISDVINMYIEEGGVGYSIMNGFWSDMGTPETKKKTEDFIDGRKV